MMFLLYQLIALFVTVSSVSLYPLSEDTKTYTSVVQLKSGKVRGFVHEVEEGVKVNFYQGIRYGNVNAMCCAFKIDLIFCRTLQETI